MTKAKEKNTVGKGRGELQTEYAVRDGLTKKVSHSVTLEETRCDLC